MPANLPTPVVGAGGGQGRTPWYEQLLLTMASQGPGVLMQWLEHRQAAQQANANDTAAKLALGAFATGATPQEAAQIKAGGGDPGAPSVAGSGAPGDVMRGGVYAPPVAPERAVPNMQGMPRGVAGPLLQQLQRGRESAQQIATSKAQQGSAEAATAATNEEMRQSRILFPLKQEQARAAVRASDAQAAEAASRTAINQEQLSFAQATRRARERLAAAEALRAEGDARAAALAERKAQLDLNTWMHDRVSGDLQRITDTAINLKQMFPEVADPGALQRMASVMITGVPRATRNDLQQLYTQLANDPNADLDTLVEQRVMGTLGLSTADLDALDKIYQDAGGDAAQALKAMKANGATVTHIAKAAGYYLALTGKPVPLPDDMRAGVTSGLMQLLSKLPGASTAGNDNAIQDIGYTLMNWGTLGGLNKVLPETAVNKPATK